MKDRQAPRLALALLDRFVPDSEPLAGDLVEQFDARPSAVWFWVQVLAAIATAGERRAWTSGRCNWWICSPPTRRSGPAA